MPRAGRPVIRLVSAVPSSRADLSAARCGAEIFASGHHRYAVPICTPAAPSAKAAAMPRASVTAPAAMTGTLTASTTCGTSANVPAWVAMSSLKKMPRWPPASLPCAITTSTPRASSQRASAAVVAELITRKCPALSRCKSPASGNPKWKLTTSGFVSSTTSHMMELNAVRLLEGTGAAGSIASSR